MITQTKHPLAYFIINPSKDFKKMISLSLMMRVKQKRKNDTGHTFREEADMRSSFLSLVAHQSSLLQNYRSMFISSQAILVSIASLILAIAEKSLLKILIIAFFFIGGVALVYTWKKITDNRKAIVFYCQLQLLRLEKGKLSESDACKLYLRYLTFEYRKDITEKKGDIQKNLKIELLGKEEGVSHHDWIDFDRVLYGIFVVMWLFILIMTPSRHFGLL